MDPSGVALICRRPATLVLECVCILGHDGHRVANECDSVQDNRPDIREQSQERASPSYHVSFKQEIVWSPSLKAGSSPTSGLFLLAETGHLHQVKLASLKLVGWLIHSPSRTVFWLLRFPLAVGAVVPFSVWSILPLSGRVNIIVACGFSGASPLACRPRRASPPACRPHFFGNCRSSSHIALFTEGGRVSITTVADVNFPSPSFPFTTSPLLYLMVWRTILVSSVALL